MHSGLTFHVHLLIDDDELTICTNEAVQSNLLVENFVLIACFQDSSSSSIPNDTSTAAFLVCFLCHLSVVLHLSWWKLIVKIGCWSYHWCLCGNCPRGVPQRLSARATPWSLCGPFQRCWNMYFQQHCCCDQCFEGQEACWSHHDYQPGRLALNCATTAVLLGSKGDGSFHSRSSFARWLDVVSVVNSWVITDLFLHLRLVVGSWGWGCGRIQFKYSISHTKWWRYEYFWHFVFWRTQLDALFRIRWLWISRILLLHCCTHWSGISSRYCDSGCRFALFFGVVTLLK